MKVRVSLNFNKPDTQIAAEAVGAYGGLKENSSVYVNPPISLDVFKGEIDIYASKIAAAADGGKLAIIARNKQREIVVKMMRQLGHWVEANCKDDLGTFKLSGFQTVSSTRTPAQPLPPPVILKAENGPATGQMGIKVTAIPKALSYEVQVAPIGADGKPGAWKLLPPFTNSRTISVTGLTPGTSYAFQVRALGKLGYTEWSDSATRMSV